MKFTTCMVELCRTTKAYRLGFGVLIAGSIVGCSSNNGPPTGSAPAAPSTWNVDLEACRGDTSEADLNSKLVIVADVEGSYHEMVACGGAAVSFAGAIAGLLNGWLVEGSIDRPDGITFLGDGRYEVSAPNGVSMEILVRYGPNQGIGDAGQPVEHDLFDSENYLLGASLDLQIDLDSIEATLEFSQTGPLIGLLGQGEELQSPWSVNTDDLAAALGQLGALEIVSVVSVDDAQGATDVVFDFDLGPASVGALYEGGSMPIELHGSNAVLSATSQSMGTTSSDLAFAAEGGLSGTSEFEVSGGEIDFEVLFEYEQSTYADVTVACPGEIVDL